MAHAAGVDFDAAFPDLFRRAYRVAYRLLGSRADAEEIAQEAVARAYDRWARLTDGGRGRPDGWVTTVAANLAVDRWRRRNRHGGVEVVPERSVNDPSAATRLALRDAVGHLPKRQREVVVLRYLADYSEQDVARILGCSPGAVKQHASRGLARLRTALGDDLNED
jgi:RNA polymerase sigma-70 factor (ECF subfamily)